MNILDRAIGYISPKAGHKRAIARKKMEILNSGYGNHGANQQKKSMVGWISTGGSPEEDINANLDLLRERSRDLYMGGAPIATGAIKTLRTNVVGSGLKPKPQVDIETLKITEAEAEELERVIEMEFKYWSQSKNCDAQRMNNFYELQQLAFISQLISGEVFSLLPYIPNRGVYGLAVQLVEADKVATPGKMQLQSFEGKRKISHGIELGKYNEPIAYYFMEKHPKSTELGGFTNKYKRISAYGKNNELPNVLHMMESERPGQTRGVPILSSVIESLKQLGRYTDAELMAAVVSAMYSLFITSERDEVPMSEFGEGIQVEDQVDTEDEYSYELGAGSIMSLAPGENIQEANPNRPNVAFDGFVNALCRQIGSALEIPSELLLKQFNSSYSASRAALLEAWKMFRMRREWISANFCQPIYEQWFHEAVAKGRINAPGFFNDPLIRKAYMNCEWSGPTQGQINPLMEVNAAAKRVEEGFSTRQRETIELTGGDFVNNMRQRAKEEKMVKAIEGEEGKTKTEINGEEVNLGKED